MEFAELTAAKLADYAGMYWSKELQTFGSIWLTPKFSLHDAGRVNGYALSTERVRNLRYERARLEFPGARAPR